jgi:hypothetical protein
LARLQYQAIACPFSPTRDQLCPTGEGPTPDFVQFGQEAGCLRYYGLSIDMLFADLTGKSANHILDYSLCCFHVKQQPVGGITVPKGLVFGQFRGSE